MRKKDKEWHDFTNISFISRCQFNFGLRYSVLCVSFRPVCNAFPPKVPFPLCVFVCFYLSFPDVFVKFFLLLPLAFVVVRCYHRAGRELRGAGPRRAEGFVCRSSEEGVMVVWSGHRSRRRWLNHRPLRDVIRRLRRSHSDLRSPSLRSRTRHT